MDIKNLKSIFSSRIKELRGTLNYSTKGMGDCLRASQTSYRRYEQGKILPGYPGLYSIAEKLGISLDWLVCGKGPVYYKEKETKDLAESPIYHLFFKDFVSGTWNCLEPGTQGNRATAGCTNGHPFSQEFDTFWPVTVSPGPFHCPLFIQLSHIRTHRPFFHSIHNY